MTTRTDVRLAKPARPRRAGPVAAVALLLASSGCQDALEPGTGAIHVVIAAVGEDVGSFYTLSIDDRPAHSVAVNETTKFSGLPSGTHTVRLLGVPQNCAVHGENPVTAMVQAGRATVLTFPVTCTPTRGSVRVAVTTTGADLHAGGYVLTLRDLRSSQPRFQTTSPVTTNGSVVFSRVPAGVHSLILSAIAPNCDDRAGVRREVDVTGGDTIAIGFTVVCETVTKLAYVHASFDGGADIVVVNSNGTGTRALTTHPAWDGDPAWSPDRTRIAFATERDGNREIYVMNADGSNPLRLTNDVGSDHSPAWSPDGRRIVFVSHRGEAKEGALWIMNADGSDPVRLTSPELTGARDADPVWSPNGRTIAFTRAVFGQDPGVFVVDADGSGIVMRLAGGALSQPAWSPDGTRIAVTRRYCPDFYGCGEQIAVYEVDVGNATFYPETGRDPAWSADGRHIAYEGLLCDFYFIECKSSGIRIVRADATSVFAVAVAGRGVAW